VSDTKEASLSGVFVVPGGVIVSGNALTTTVWVEGARASDTVGDAALRADYEGIAQDEAVLTIVGVESMRWLGRGNSLNDDDNLDACPNANGTNAVRVFPGARATSTALALNTVDLETRLTVAPPEPLSIRLRAFDVDDPTTHSGPVDDETSPEDNRGSAGSLRCGRFVDSGADHVDLVFGPTTRTLRTRFEVSMQPGDNFKVVGNGDPDFLSQLENDDRLTTATAEDGQRIHNIHVPGSIADREVGEADHYCTRDTLTVWRFLHVELDSMEVVATTGTQSNVVYGNVTAIHSSATGLATSLTLSVNLATGLPSGADDSANLDGTPPGNGRFENGFLCVGIGAGMTTTSMLDGNGGQFVQQRAGISIPFETRNTSETPFKGLHQIHNQGESLMFKATTAYAWISWLCIILSFLPSAQGHDNTVSKEAAAILAEAKATGRVASFALSDHASSISQFLAPKLTDIRDPSVRINLIMNCVDIERLHPSHPIYKTRSDNYGLRDALVESFLTDSSRRDIYASSLLDLYNLDDLTTAAEKLCPPIRAREVGINDDSVFILYAILSKENSKDVQERCHETLKKHSKWTTIPHAILARYGDKASEDWLIGRIAELQGTYGDMEITRLEKALVCANTRRIAGACADQLRTNDPIYYAGGVMISKRHLFAKILGKMFRDAPTYPFPNKMPDWTSESYKRLETWCTENLGVRYPKEPVVLPGADYFLKRQKRDNN
jgi:hypothetical protein